MKSKRDNNTARRILVFGYFGYENNRINGQTIKTREVYEMLRERSGAEVRFADSQTFRTHPAKVIRFLRDMAWCNTLVWLPAYSNLRYLFRIIRMFSAVFGFDIIYPVVGGQLSQFLLRLPYHRRHLGKLKAILAENQLTVNELHNRFGFNNVEIFPNFREICPQPEFSTDLYAPLRLVFMARICMEKGIDVIAGLCEARGARTFTIDFYGQIDPKDEEYFRTQLVEKYPFVKYNGLLAPDEIANTLGQYDVMLLPTRYPGEGFPGSVMDAYRVGIPVIVSDWRYAREFVTEGVSGYIADYDRPLPGVIAAVERIDDDRNLLTQLKRSAYAESLKYSPDRAWEILSKYLT